MVVRRHKICGAGAISQECGASRPPRNFGDNREYE
jgi:hypothetical protein